MKFNTKTRYGLRTMVEIAIRGRERGVLQKEISERQKISFKYLDPIVAALKAAGLIVKAGGRMSGYRLSRDPAAISTYDIYRAFERELIIADCLAGGENGGHDHYSASREFWLGLNDLIVQYLRSIKLEDIAKKQQAINARKEEPMFFI